MPEELSPADRKAITKVGILTQEIALLQARLDEWKSQQKALVIDLVQREIISQSRGSKIAEVQRQTISRWLQEAFDAPLSEEEKAGLRKRDETERD